MRIPDKARKAGERSRKPEQKGNRQGRPRGADAAVLRTSQPAAAPAPPRRHVGADMKDLQGSAPPRKPLPRVQRPSHRGCLGAPGPLGSCPDRSGPTGTGELWPVTGPGCPADVLAPWPASSLLPAPPPAPSIPLRTPLPFMFPGDIIFEAPASARRQPTRTRTKPIPARIEHRPPCSHLHVDHSASLQPPPCPP